MLLVAVAVDQEMTVVEEDLVVVQVVPLIPLRLLVQVIILLLLAVVVKVVTEVEIKLEQ